MKFKKTSFLLLLGILLISTFAYATTVATFESDSVSKWGLYEVPGAWWTNPNNGFSLHPWAYWMSETGTDFARIVWDTSSSSENIWALSLTPTRSTTCVIRYRGYAGNTTPSFSFRFASYGQDSTGATHNWNNIYQSTVSDTTWTVVTCNLGIDSTGLISDIWFWCWGASGAQLQGMDIDYIQINGVEAPQKDASGSAGGWFERDLNGWAHGHLSSVSVGSTYGNVGVMQIWSGDASAAMRAAFNFPIGKWIDVTAEKYLQFDWMVAPGTNPTDAAMNIMLFSKSLGDGQWVNASDTNPPSSWTHQVYDISTSVSSAGIYRNDIWRLDFAVTDLLNDIANPHLVGFYVDNIEFKNVPVPVELSRLELY